MAYPRVFISSTCYDLAQIRDSLSEFISGYCYESILSDHGDVFYHPDLHSHESCINEIDNCQLFILIIGGRFGGNYISDKTKSIVNAEYEAAKLRKIPVFTFIKREVYDDHRVYQKNKNNSELIKEIIFPSIDNQSHAISIFEFINQVRLSDVNNGFCSFEFVKDMKLYLGKQWAGMMFDFLNFRNKNESEKVVKNTLENLTLLNKKTEELLEGIVRKLNPKNGNDQIEDINKIISASLFYNHILEMFNHESQVWIDKIINIKPIHDEWYKYLNEIDDFELENRDKDYPFQESFKTILSLRLGSSSWSVVTEDDIYPNEVILAMKLYKNIRSLKVEEIVKAIEIVKKSKEFK